MLAMADFSGLGWGLILGMCDGDTVLAEATRSAMMGDSSTRSSARDAKMAEATFREHVERVRGKLARLIDGGCVLPGELVQAPEE